MFIGIEPNDATRYDLEASMGRIVEDRGNEYAMNSHGELCRLVPDNELNTVTSWVIGAVANYPNNDEECKKHEDNYPNSKLRELIIDRAKAKGEEN